jgi:hypothetical protein
VPKNAFKILMPSILLLIAQLVDAQSFKIYGTVYDYFTKQPLDAVAVRTTNGNFTLSDSLGKYSIEITGSKDSVWFSYLTKNTQKYPADTIKNTLNFDVALYVDAAWLPEVKVKNRNYLNDSLQNRQDYAKVFNFKKPGLRLTSASPSSYVPGSVTVGLDLEELINMFRFKRNRQMLALQTRLLQEEQDKYIDHRFTKRLVSQLTGLKTPSIEPFMLYSRPSYELLTYMNDLELGYYIEQSFIIYKNVLKRKINLTN